MKLRAKNLPSLASRLGRITADTSKWPQACGTYHAMVKSGAVALAMLVGVTPLVSSDVLQVEVAAASCAGPAAVQLVVRVGIAPASEPSIPLAVAMSVCGVSADTENEPPNGTGTV